MAIFVIGDLHLSFQEYKPMSIFGTNWEKHEEKIRKDWMQKVTQNDLVVLPGDFSWAMHLKDTQKDFAYLNTLPGKKLLLKGNHDYWWTTVTNMKKFLEENQFSNIDFLYNNAYEFDNKILVGTRGWVQSEEEEDKKILKREALRLEMSIKDGIQKGGTAEKIIAFMHYPPVIATKDGQKQENTLFEVLKKYQIKNCYYGHLHAQAIRDAVQGNYKGINLKLVSADGLDFKLLPVLD